MHSTRYAKTEWRRLNEIPTLCTKYLCTSIFCLIHAAGINYMELTGRNMRCLTEIQSLYKRHVSGKQK